MGRSRRRAGGGVAGEGAAVAVEARRRERGERRGDGVDICLYIYVLLCTWCVCIAIKRIPAQGHTVIRQKTQGVCVRARARAALRAALRVLLRSCHPAGGVPSSHPSRVRVFFLSFGVCRRGFVSRKLTQSQTRVMALRPRTPQG